MHFAVCERLCCARNSTDQAVGNARDRSGNTDAFAFFGLNAPRRTTLCPSPECFAIGTCVQIRKTRSISYIPDVSTLITLRAMRMHRWDGGILVDGEVDVLPAHFGV